MESTDGRVKHAKNDQESFKVYIHTLAPHTAFGPGAYAMHTLKKMTGKSSFYQMPDNQKECQVHSREKCQTEMFLKHVKTNCSCVPWALTTENSYLEVILKTVHSISKEGNFFPKGAQLLWTRTGRLCCKTDFERRFLLGCLQWPLY